MCSLLLVCKPGYATAAAVGGHPDTEVLRCLAHFLHQLHNVDDWSMNVCLSIVCIFMSHNSKEERLKSAV